MASLSRRLLFWKHYNRLGTAALLFMTSLRPYCLSQFSTSSEDYQPSGLPTTELGLPPDWRINSAVLTKLAPSSPQVSGVQVTVVFRPRTLAISESHLPAATATRNSAKPSARDSGPLTCRRHLLNQWIYIADHCRERVVAVLLKNLS